MPQRSKSSAKSDTSQSEVLHRRTKRLRIDSDEEEDEGYEPLQDRSTSYNESYTRGGGRDSSPPEPAPATTKRQKLTSTSSEEGEGCEYEDRMRDYDDRQDDEDDEDYSGRDNTATYREDEDGYIDYNSEQHGKKRRGEPASPSRKESLPPGVPTSASAPPQAASVPTGGRVRRPSIRSKYMNATHATTATPAPTTKRSTAKGKQKALISTSSSKRKRKEEESDEEEEYHSYEDEDLEEGDEDDETRLSEESDDCEEPAKGKKRRGSSGGRGTAREIQREKDKDMVPILKKAKFEGNLTTPSPTSTRRPRAKKQTGEDAVVDIIDDAETPEPSSLTSPTTIAGADGSKGDTSTANSAPPGKKRKLPMIKKLKNTASLSGAVSATVGGTGTGPSTPSSGLAQGGKSATLPQPSSSGITGGAVSKLGIIPAGGSTRPKANATSDLDLSNPSLYAELFKNPGGSASRTGLNRRAKEEERKKELDKMRDDYKAKLAGVKVSFDLQAQAEKMARFEEMLRQRRSSALYPNFLGAKWREESEKEKRRLLKLQCQQQTQVNGHVDNTKEEGEM